MKLTSTERSAIIKAIKEWEAEVTRGNSIPIPMYPLDRAFLLNKITNAIEGNVE